jgi:S1-C subfamily serine protease
VKQGDLLRLFGLLATACVAAALVLVGAEIAGGLGSTTTVDRFVPAPSGEARSASRAAGSAALSIEQIYRLDAPGVVEISVASPGARRRAGSPGAGETIRTLGSGFVIDKAGHILTTSGVVAGTRRVQVSFTGDDQMQARIVGVDAVTGVAVLQIDAHSRALSPLPLGDSDDVQVGDLVVAIGNPTSFARTATAGIVSAVQRTIDPAPSAVSLAHSIETDAAIDRGDSGGPLINAQGAVIGVNGSTTSGDQAPGSAGGLGFAIPIDTVKAAVAQLIHDGRVEHAFLGVSAVPLTSGVARTFNLPSSRGLLVQTVARGSGASRAGLRAGSTMVVVAGETYRIGGDIIIAADGVPIVSEADLRNVLQALAPGDALRLQLWRSGKKETVLAILGRPPG